MAIKTKKQAEAKKPLDTKTPPKGNGTKGLLSSDKKPTGEKIQKTVSKGGKNEGGKMQKSTKKLTTPKVSKEEAKRIQREELRQAKTLVAWEMLEIAANGAKKLKKFSDVQENKIAFAAYCSLPDISRVITQGQFAERYKVDESTLSRWKLTESFKRIRDYIMLKHFQSKTPLVLQNLFEGATSTSFGAVNDKAIKLFLQYVEKWSETQNVDLTSEGEKIQGITWGLPISQFAKQDKLPKKKSEAEQYKDEDED